MLQSFKPFKCFKESLDTPMDNDLSEMAEGSGGLAVLGESQCCEVTVQVARGKGDGKVAVGRITA